jgi:hypothetical protein
MPTYPPFPPPPPPPQYSSASPMDQAEALLTQAMAQLQGASGATGPPVFPDDDTYDDGLGARYDLYGSSVDYSYNSGLLQIPVAVDPSTATPRPLCTIVRTAAPIGQKVVLYFARRVGAQPLFPYPEPDSATQVLLTARVRAETPPLDDAGTNRIFVGACVYIYAMIAPLVAWTDGFSPGAAPHTAFVPADNLIPASQFVTGIINSDVVGGGAASVPFTPTMPAQNEFITRGD